MTGMTGDFTGAVRKTQALLNSGKALRFQAQVWADGTVKDLKRSAAAMQAGHAMGHGKTGALSRSVGRMIATSGSTTKITIGTGIGSVKNLPYPHIQDVGGTVRAVDKFFTINNIQGKPRLGPFLTVPLRGVKGKMSNYKDAFAIRSAAGNLVVVQPLAYKSGKRKGQRKTGRAAGIKPLFVLKQSVKIPASLWFTGVIDRREPVLAEMITPEVLLNIAAQLPGGGGL